MPNPGQYDTRLLWKVHSNSEPNVRGAVEATYTDNGYLWCMLSKPRGEERVIEGNLKSVVSVRVSVRGTPGVRSVDRFQDGNTVYLIEGVHVDENEEICFCVTVN